MLVRIVCDKKITLMDFNMVVCLTSALQHCFDAFHINLNI